MTIACCYLTPGGVVLGADSTQTFQVGTGYRHFEHAQKLFEVGEDSTLGIVTWGWGGDLETSFRKLIAEFADLGAQQPFASVMDAATRWSSHFSATYRARKATQVARATELLAKMRTPQEEAELQQLNDGHLTGFILGGYVPPSRDVEAYTVIASPSDATDPKPQPIQIGFPTFFGVPNIIDRVINGIDTQLFMQITSNPMWTGTDQDLLKLMAPAMLSPPRALPIREAIDYVYSIINTTCDGLRFSLRAPICGGPIEIAVITCDRRFRWANHKPMAVTTRSD